MDKLDLPHIIKEKFFASGNALLRPITIHLGQMYPMSKRSSTFPTYNAAVEEEYNDKCKSSRDFLYEQRNIVQRKWLPRFMLTRGKRVESRANMELKHLLVDGSLDRLFETLVAYTPLWVNGNDLLSIQATMKNVYDNESRKLDDELSGYNAVYAVGVKPLEEEMAD
jgi:hypothetical protein